MNVANLFPADETAAHARQRHQRSRAAIAAVLWLAAPVGIARADAVTEWMAITVEADRADEKAHPEPHDLTAWTPKDESDELVAVAIYQAVNAAEPHYTPFRAGVTDVVSGASAQAAAIAAGHAALVAIFPEQKENLDDAYTISLAGVAAGPARDAGVSLGERVAADTIRWRSADHTEALAPLRPSAVPGVWVPSTPMTIPLWMSSARPWLMRSRDQFRAPPPPALKTTAYARDYEETRRWGAKASAARTAEQTALAKFYMRWQPEPIVRQVAEQPGRTLAQNARLYALSYIALADAAFAQIDGKIAYAAWRPVTAIRNGDQDGNAATERDPGWEPLLQSPVQPEYPCGHCIEMAALTTVLAAEGPVPAGGIGIRSGALPGSVHRVASYAALVDEISVSRIHAGAHFRSSIDAGVVVGRSVATYVLAGFLRPIP